ncbi:MAG: class II fructose-bisphosphate aldolase [Candidatus Brocadiia bacterium]
MLATFNEILPLLESKDVCVPALDIGGCQQDFLLGVVRACGEARCPAVMLIWGPAAENYMGLDATAALVSHYGETSPVPLVLHLDHGSEELVRKALDVGFRSVMFDGSDLPLEENIALTREMAELAHEHGASIEGELGKFGREQAEEAGDAALTDPEEAERFVRETEVDIFAPAVGNAHGFYKAPPRLRFGLIEDIAGRTGVPLSLHGGTGIPLEDVRRAGRLGMRKINVASQLHRDFSNAMKAANAEVDDRKFSWGRALRAGREAIHERAAEYIRELACEGLVP